MYCFHIFLIAFYSAQSCPTSSLTWEVALRFVGDLSATSLWNGSSLICQFVTIPLIHHILVSNMTLLHCPSLSSAYCSPICHGISHTQLSHYARPSIFIYLQLLVSKWFLYLFKCIRPMLFSTHSVTIKCLNLLFASLNCLSFTSFVLLEHIMCVITNCCIRQTFTRYSPVLFSLSYCSPNPVTCLPS